MLPSGHAGYFDSGNSEMKLFLMVISVVSMVAAGVALWRQQLNVAFVVATIGVLAWFLRYRSDLKESLTENGSVLRDDPEVDSSNEGS
jgi:hypothetical protein